jgi:hypothetical protein
MLHRNIVLCPFVNGTAAALLVSSLSLHPSPYNLKFSLTSLLFSAVLFPSGSLLMSVFCLVVY